MNPYITCHVEGDPKPQPRPKVNTHTRSVYYEGKGYKAWRALLTEQFSLLLRSVKGFPEPARVSVFINVRIARPASHFKKSGEIRPAFGRNLPPGDVDNHAKVILDAAQDAGIFADDRQVRFLSVDCDWTGPNELPGARVRVTEITWREKGQKKERKAVGKLSLCRYCVCGQCCPEKGTHRWPLRPTSSPPTPPPSL